jgi:hypothetical protein
MDVAVERKVIDIYALIADLGQKGKVDLLIFAKIVRKY